MKAKKQPKFIVEVQTNVGLVGLKDEIQAALEEKFGAASVTVKRLNAAAVQKLARDRS